MPPPRDGEGGATPSAAPLNESSASHHSIHSLATNSNGLTGRAYCRAVVADIEKRRLQKRPVRVNFDGLAANRRRAGAAVRLVGGDPEAMDIPAPRYQHPSTGLRASGFREGYEHCAAAAADDLRRLYKQMEPGTSRDTVAELGRQYAGMSADVVGDLREAA